MQHESGTFWVEYMGNHVLIVRIKWGVLLPSLWTCAWGWVSCGLGCSRCSLTWLVASFVWQPTLNGICWNLFSWQLRNPLGMYQIKCRNAVCLHSCVSCTWTSTSDVIYLHANKYKTELNKTDKDAKLWEIFKLSAFSDWQECIFVVL